METSLAVSEPGIIAKGSVLDYSQLKNEALIDATRSLETYAGQGMAMAKAYSREIAITLHKINSNKLYAKDGFKNVVEYANAVKFTGDTRSKQSVYQHVFAGTVYCDKTLPDTIKNMNVMSLNVLKAALSDKEKRAKIVQDAKNGKDFAGMTQKQVIEYRKTLDDKPETPFVVDTYIQFIGTNNSSLVALISDLNLDDADKMFFTMDDYDEHAKTSKKYGEWLKLKPIEYALSKNEKYKIERRIGINSNYIPTLYYYIPYYMCKALHNVPRVTTPVNEYSEAKEEQTRFLISAGYQNLSIDDIVMYFKHGNVDDIVNIYGKMESLYPTFIEAIHKAINTRSDDAVKRITEKYISANSDDAANTAVEVTVDSEVESAAESEQTE